MDLLDACQFDPVKAIQLIQEGANVHVKNRHGEMPLHLACSCQPSLVERLVKAGADVNAKTHDGITPLTYAAHDPDIARYLISQGADVHARAYDTYTVLDLVCMLSTTPIQTIRILYDATTEPIISEYFLLTQVIALYAGMCWKRSKVGGLSSRILTEYMVRFLNIGEINPDFSTERVEW
jgi:ankyrin repeat protein